MFNFLFIDNWNRTSHQFEAKEFGKWELFLPLNDGKFPIQHGSKYKVSFNMYNIYKKIYIL